MIIQILFEQAEGLVREFLCAVMRQASVEAGEREEVTGDDIWFAADCLKGGFQKPPRGVPGKEFTDSADTELCFVESWIRGVLTERLEAVIASTRQQGIWEKAA